MFSKCGSYRWILKRELLVAKKTLVYFGLNPSKANSFNNDKTLIRIINFSSRWNYKNIYIINLFGLIAKSPLQLSKSKDSIVLNNDLITLITLQFWWKNINFDFGWALVIKVNSMDVIVKFCK